MAEKKLKENTEVKSVSLIFSPRITEKASKQSEVNAYTFVVSKDATKISLAKEILKTYKVKPVAINILNTKGKLKFTRGAFGTTQGIKKAIVFLKKGDTISLS
jgi:large subunit ribosomal protein L23